MVSVFPPCSLFLAKVQAEILDGVCAVIQKTTDKQTCMWSLWALSKQNFSPAVLAEKVSRSLACGIVLLVHRQVTVLSYLNTGLLSHSQADSLINVLEISQCSKQFQSMTVEHESINLLIRYGNMLLFRTFSIQHLILMAFACVKLSFSLVS